MKWLHPMTWSIRSLATACLALACNLSGAEETLIISPELYLINTLSLQNYYFLEEIYVSVKDDKVKKKILRQMLFVKGGAMLPDIDQCKKFTCAPELNLRISSEVWGFLRDKTITIYKENNTHPLDDRLNENVGEYANRLGKLLNMSLSTDKKSEKSVEPEHAPENPKPPNP